MASIKLALQRPAAEGVLIMEVLKKLGTKLANLIDVKSLTTLALMAAFVFLSVTGVIASEQFLQIFLVIITYYFTKKSDSSNKEE